MVIERDSRAKELEDIRRINQQQASEIEQLGSSVKWLEKKSERGRR